MLVNKIGNASSTIYKSIFIQEGELVVKNVSNRDESIQTYQSRHRIFCYELGWVPQTKDGLEIDKYDNRAIPIGVFNDQNKLLGFLRILMPTGPFMLEKEFLSLVGLKHKIRKEDDTAEVSRLCVTPEARKYKISSDFRIWSISMMLFKGIYHWCIKNNVKYLYLVVELKIFRLLQAKGFPCKFIGKPKVMPDGIVALAAIMDWREFEMFNAVKRPNMLKWFTQYQSIPAQWQRQQPEAYLQHQAYA